VIFGEIAVNLIDAVFAKARRHRSWFRSWNIAVLFVLLFAQSFAVSSARADLKICNRMSYVVEAAIGIDDKGTTATRGWFRVDPAQCRVVAQGTLSADRILLHARSLPVYGASPVPQNGSDNLCIAPNDFVIAAARQCRAGQTAAAFTEIKPSTDDNGNQVAYLAEDSEYDDEQARLAAIQRLLVIAGYDAAPIDGVDGPKTQNALSAFLKTRGLGADTVQAPNFFETMIAAVESPSATGLTWCNDTSYRVMASIGTDDGKAVTNRGWYRIEPGKCLHPDIRGQPRKVYSFAEAVDTDGRTIKINSRALNWGGSATLCTRESQFEFTEQSDCGARGLNASGYVQVDMSVSTGKTLRFGMP
jgi:uncharacterized membrane protein